MARVGAFWIIGSVIAFVGWPAAGALPPNSSDRAALASFKALDRQGNLHLSPDDLSSGEAARRLFTILDRSGDGALTAVDGPPARHLLHRSGARTISASRFASLGPSRWIAALDVDGDGRLSLNELRPSLAGNAPLDTQRPPSPRPDIVELPARPKSCWFFDGIRWIELPGTTPICRMR